MYFEGVEIFTECSKNRVFPDFLVYFRHMFVMHTWKIFPHERDNFCQNQNFEKSTNKSGKTI